jgi:hypothetical protein
MYDSFCQIWDSESTPELSVYLSRFIIIVAKFAIKDYFIFMLRCLNRVLITFLTFWTISNENMNNSFGRFLLKIYTTLFATFGIWNRLLDRTTPFI